MGPTMRILTEYTATEQYRDYLDEVSGTVKIGSLEYDASRVLEAVDPIAFSVGFNEYCDDQGIEIGDEDSDESDDEDESER